MKEGREGGGEGNSLFQYLILEPVHLHLWMGTSAPSKHGDHTHVLDRMPSSVLKSLSYCFKMRHILAFFYVTLISPEPINRLENPFIRTTQGSRLEDSEGRAI